MKAGAVILAAGEAKRAGGPKVVWPVGGIPSVRRVAEAAVEANMIKDVAVVIGGPWAGKVTEALDGLKVKLIINPDYAQGQSTSLKAGLNAIHGCESVVFILADQPFLSARLLDDLIMFHNKSGGTISAPSLCGKRFNPVIFCLRRFRDKLMMLQGDTGGREILTGHKSELNLWEAEEYDMKCFSDFDTIDEYERLESGE